jgi:hypothetical protein
MLSAKMGIYAAEEATWARARALHLTSEIGQADEVKLGLFGALPAARRRFAMPAASLFN